VEKMSKGQETRERIIARAAPLFNQQGYSGTSMSDVMQATGLEKGGLYNHFKGKDELALASFDYNVHLIRRRLARGLKGVPRRPAPRLIAILRAHASVLEELPVIGGCPILNTAVESDDTHPALRERAREALDEWRRLIVRLIDEGIAAGEFEPEVDGEELATLLIAGIEGGIMLSKLYDDNVHIHRVLGYWSGYIENKLVRG
jgi:AcrR family transcriptional regulator